MFFFKENRVSGTHLIWYHNGLPQLVSENANVTFINNDSDIIDDNGGLWRCQSERAQKYTTQKVLGH